MYVAKMESVLLKICLDVQLMTCSQWWLWVRCRINIFCLIRLHGGNHYHACGGFPAPAHLIQMTGSLQGLMTDDLNSRKLLKHAGQAVPWSERHRIRDTLSIFWIYWHLSVQVSTITVCLLWHRLWVPDLSDAEWGAGVWISHLTSGFRQGLVQIALLIDPPVFALIRSIETIICQYIHKVTQPAARQLSRHWTSYPGSVQVWFKKNLPSVISMAQ